MTSSLEGAPDIADPEFAEFWTGCAARRLMMPCCADGHRHWPPRPICRFCGRATSHWVEVAPYGQLYSWTIIHQTRLASFAAKVPYVVALATLRDLPSIRFVARCSGRFDLLRVGAELELRFDEVIQGLRVPYWQLSQTPPGNPAAG